MIEPQSIDSNLNCCCPECGKEFPNYQKAKAHIARYHVADPICPVCCVYYNSKRRLSYHVRTDHPFCGDCRMRFRDKDDYYMHNLSKHIEEVIISNKLLTGATQMEKKCRLCGIKLATRSYAHIHIQYAHPLIKPFFTHLQSN